MRMRFLTAIIALFSLWVPAMCPVMAAPLSMDEGGVSVHPSSGSSVEQFNGWAIGSVATYGHGHVMPPSCCIGTKEHKKDDPVTLPVGAGQIGATTIPFFTECQNACAAATDGIAPECDKNDQTFHERSVMRRE